MVEIKVVAKAARSGGKSSTKIDRNRLLRPTPVPKMAMPMPGQ